MAVPLSAAHVGGSRLCGDSGRPVWPRPDANGAGGTRHCSVDELLVSGPKGGPGSPQGKRHQRVLESQEKLDNAAALAVDRPEMLHAMCGEHRDHVGSGCWSEAQGKLGTVILDRVRHSFLGTSVAHPRSSMRTERLQELHKDLAWADSLSPHCSEQHRSELEQLRGDVNALQAIARAQELRQEAMACAAEEAAADHALVAAAGLTQATAAAAQRCHAAEAERGRIVGEGIEMLKHWKRHSEVAFQLASAMLAMVESDDNEFAQEMDRRGLGVLASTVADVWAGRPEVAKVALRLLGAVNLEHLIRHLEEVLQSEGRIVFLGLEALNKLTGSNMEVVDEAVRHGAREMLDEVDDLWAQDRMIALLSLNLRRRLRKSRAEPLRRKKEVLLPPEEVVRLRGCFDYMDQDNSGFIDASELSLALKLVGIKANQLELEDRIAEVDVNNSGRMEFAEFMWVMSRFGKNQTIEAQFTDERLAELREVFDAFDKDGGGTVNVTELSVCLRSVGLNLADFELRAMIDEFDANASGSIDWLEFLYLMSRKVVDPQNQHQLAFQFFDQDNSGLIDKQEFVDRMVGLSNEFTAEELEQLILEAKFENGDLDTITYQEFVKLMMRP